MSKKEDNNNRDLEPQKSSAAQFITYIASTGAGGEKYEIRYEDENIWMSQKMLAAVYGVEVPNIAYHLRKLFTDAELDKSSVIKEILITADDGKKYSVNHYNLQDRLFMSDYNRYLLKLEEQIKEEKGDEKGTEASK